MRRKRCRKGYTLIELITVIFIIATIAAIIMPNLRRALEKTHVVACKTNLRNIGTALSLYSNDNGGRFPSGLNKITPDYMQVLPSCPAVSIDTYTGGYQVNADNDIYTLSCHGINHSSYDYGQDEPYYTSAGELAPDY